MDTDSIVTDELEQHDDINEDQQSVDPRAARLAEIAASRSEEREAENDPDDDNDDSNIVDSGHQKREDQQSQSRVYQRDGQSFVKLKVDGQEVERTLDDVIAVKQKEESADSRLSKAAAEAKRLQEVERRLVLREQSLNAQATQARSAQLSTEDVAAQKQQAAEYRKALYDGDEEKADEIMAELLSAGRRPATPAINVDQIAQQAENRVIGRIKTEKYNSQIENINATFEKEYSDIVKDENLYSMAKQYARTLHKDNPGKPLEDVMKESGSHNRR